MKLRYKVILILTGIALVLFLKDDRLRRENRSRLYRHAKSTHSLAATYKDSIPQVLDLQVKAQDLIDSIGPALANNQKAREIYDTAQGMKMKALSRENDLREKYTTEIQEYNDLVQEFNDIPPSLFEDDDIPEKMEKSNQAL